MNSSLISLTVYGPQPPIASRIALRAASGTKSGRRASAKLPVPRLLGAGFISSPAVEFRTETNRCGRENVGLGGHAGIAGVGQSQVCGPEDNLCLYKER